MNSDFSFQPENPSEDGNVKRFEEMIRSKKDLFFDVDEFEDLVQHYSAINDTAKALKVLEYGLSQHPQSAALMLSCAQLYLSVHKPQDALKHLRKAESFEPFNIDLFYTKATIFSQLRQHDKAIEQFKKAIDFADAEEKEDILLQLAFEYENADKYDMAIETLQSIVEINNENETALYELGYCFDLENKTEDGKNYFLSFIDRYPYSYIAWFNLGITYAKLSLYEKAIESYDFCIAIKEDFSSAYFNKAQCYISQDLHEKALECFNEILTFDTHDPLVYSYMGECYEKLESYDQAIHFYKKAVDVDAFFPEAWTGIASCFYELGMDQEALPYVTKAIEIDKLYWEAHHLKGDILRQLGRQEEALAAYEMVYEFDEENDNIYIDLAYTHEELGDTDAATGYFQEGLHEQEDNAKLLYNFVAFLLKKGQTMLAMFYLDTALKKHFDSHHELFEAYEAAKYNTEVLDMIEFHKK